MAERLVVACIPEERLVATVGNDVIDVRGRDHSSVLLANPAERVLSQVTLSVTSPARVISTLRCGTTPLVDGLPSSSTMTTATTATKNQHATLRARCRRSSRH